MTDRRLTPTTRTDDGDGTVTWAPAMDGRTRAAHRTFPGPFRDWPGAAIPEVKFRPLVCIMPELKTSAQFDKERLSDD